MNTATEELKSSEVAEEMSADEIAASIAELKAKLKKVELDSEEDLPKVLLPIADAHIKIEKGQTVWRRMITPPELLLLIAIHRKGSGGEPLQELVLAKGVREKLNAQADKEMNKDRKAWLQGIATIENIPDKVEVDPRALKNSLINRYGGEKVEKLFPGSEPKLPETFRRAIGLSSEAKVEPGRLFDIQAFGGE